MATTEVVWIDRIITVIGAVGVFMIGVIFTQMYVHPGYIRLRHNYETVIDLSLHEMNKTLELSKAYRCFLLYVVRYICEHEESLEKFPHCEEELKSTGYLDDGCAGHMQDEDGELPLFSRMYTIGHLTVNGMTSIVTTMSTIRDLRSDVNEPMLKFDTGYSWIQRHASRRTMA